MSGESIRKILGAPDRQGQPECRVFAAITLLIAAVELVRKRTSLLEDHRQALAAFTRRCDVVTVSSVQGRVGQNHVGCYRRTIQ